MAVTGQSWEEVVVVCFVLPQVFHRGVQFLFRFSWG